MTYKICFLDENNQQQERDATPEEISEIEARKAEALQHHVDDLIFSITQAVQKRLDDWAKTRNYDGILSLCSYATDPSPKFAQEGQRGVDLRSATWAKLYGIMADVQEGRRPMPLGYADIEPELPELEWPA